MNRPGAPLKRAPELASSLIGPGCDSLIRISLALLVALGLSGCGSSPPVASPDVTIFSGPLAVPYPDSIDLAWSDTLSTPPSPPVKGARPKRRKPPPPAANSPGNTTPVAPGPVATVTNPPVSTGTSEATGLDSSSAALPQPASGAQSGADTNAAPSAPTPQLTVRLSSEEVARLVERWQADVTRAEKAVDALKATTLAGEAADQVAAAKKFLTDARVARKSSDYYRACELAEKARVLAEAIKVSVGK